MIAQAQDETAQKVEKSKSDLKTAFMNLDYVLGTYSGLCGTDVMVVILALFVMDVDSLIALLNDNELSNLNSVYGVTTFAREMFGPVDVAIGVLQAKVAEIFAELDKVINDNLAKTELMKDYISVVIP